MDDFKEIPGYEGLYQVDKNGNVYSLQTSRYLKPSISRAGYKQWVTRKENNNYMGNRAAEASKKKFSKEFYAFTKNGELIGKYIGVNEYAKANNLSPGNLSTILTKNSESENKYSYRGVVYIYENE